MRSTLINTMYQKELEDDGDKDTELFSKRGYEIFKLLLSRIGKFEEEIRSFLCFENIVRSVKEIREVRI